MKFLKRILSVAALALALSMSVVASAAPHSVTLTFTRSVDDSQATGQGYTAWRMSGACPASVTTTTGFTSLNASLFTTTTYVDSTVVPGSYCYIVTFSNPTATSVPSNTAPAVILPAAPTNVTVTGTT